jgi:CRISPR-associated protein Csd2
MSQKSASLSKKIDLVVVARVENANPNGDPLNANFPRQTLSGHGKIEDVCLKRKIRNRLQDMGLPIFVQSDDRKTDGQPSLMARAVSTDVGLGADAFNIKKTPRDVTKKLVCQKWYDVRAFGQVFAFKNKNDDNKDDGVSISITGPVSIQHAFSVEPVAVYSDQITKSVNGQASKSGNEEAMSSDRMGSKSFVEKGIYVAYGSISPYMAEKTGFSDEDAEVLKTVLPTLFENDASTARPEGSMSVLHVVWIEHNCKAGQYSSGRVHRAVSVNADGFVDIDEDAIPGLKIETIPGF